MATAVLVVELRLRYGVVHVDGREEERTVALHLVEAVHTSGGLFGDTDDVGGHGLEDLLAARNNLVEQIQDDAVLFGVGGVRCRHDAGNLEFTALVDEEGGVATVVQDHVGAGVSGPAEQLLGAPPVLLQRLTLPGEDGSSLGVVDGAVRSDDHGRSRVVLGREDVAADPTDVGTEGHEGLDEDGSLDGHVEGTGNAGTLQGLAGTELGAHGHEARHFVFGQLDFSSAVVG